MAARRLMIIMLVLLAISAGAAALVPTRDSNEDTVGSTGTDATGGSTATKPEATDPPEPPVGEQASPTFDIKVGGRKLPIVPVVLGQQVTLIVRSKLTDQLEIPALGLIEPVAPGAPARFELFPQEAGDLGIRLIGGDRVVARIEVSSRGGRASGPKRPAGRQGAS